MEQKRPYDEISVQEMGGSLFIVIPKKISKFLEIVKGDKVNIDAETGKYGRYMTAWKKVE